MKRSTRDRRARNAGMLVGILAGVADAAAVILENPASFPGIRSPAAFLGASVVIHLALGALAGIVFAAARRVVRVSDHALFAFGLAAALFVWAAIRVHVRWYFGEPLASPKSAPAFSGVAFAAALAAALATRLLRRPLDRALDARLTRPVLALGALGLALSAAGAAHLPRRAPPAAPLPGAPDILLVTLDTTRADHLSACGYPRGTTPALDRLARRGQLEPYAAAPIPLTNPSHVSMFTGLTPREHGVLNNGTRYRGEAPTLAETLASRGYSAAAFVSGIPLKAGLSGLRRGFATYDDSFSIFDRLHPSVTSLAALRAANRLVPTDLVERRAADTVRAARRWIRASRGPLFVWVHVYDAHSPYAAPPLLRGRFLKESAPWTDHGRPVTQWPVADYDAELREVDRHLEDLLREFETATSEADGGGGSGARGALVFVTADHGEGLEQHGELTHGQLRYEEDLRVPWITAPARAGDELRERRAGGALGATPRSLCDVRSWILACVGFPEEAPRASSGGLLAETFPPEGREAKSSYVETIARAGDGGGGEGARNAGPIGRKLIVNFATGATRAYDLAADPGELRPLDSSGPEWDALKRGIPAPDSSAGAPIDPEVRRRLESLGYIH